MCGKWSLGISSWVGFPGGSDGKESACSAGDWGLITGWEDPVEEGMATHSSVLAWRIPMTEEPGGLQSMGWQTVGHTVGQMKTHRGRWRTRRDGRAVWTGRAARCLYRWELWICPMGLGLVGLWGRRGKNSKLTVGTEA